MLKIRKRQSEIILVLSGLFLLYILAIAMPSVYAANCGSGVGNCACGDVVIASIVLTSSDLVTQQRCNGTALTIGNNNLTVDGGGFTIIGNASGRGINNTGGFDNITLKNFAGINNFTYGIDFTGVVNSTVFNNTVIIYNNTDGSWSTGIKLTSSSNSNNLSLNNITSVLPTNGWGMEEDYSYGNVISNNVITLNIVGSNAGIWLEGNANNQGSNITSNNITVVSYASGGYGIADGQGRSNIRYTSNRVTVSGSSISGMDLLSADNNFVTSNTITATGSSAYGLYLRTSIDNATVSSNTVIVNGQNGIGMYFSGINASVVSNNNVTTSNTTAFGIRVGASDRSNLTSNNVTTFGNSSEGIHLDASSLSIRATSNTIQTYGNNAYGIRLHERVLSNTLS